MRTARVIQALPEMNQSSGVAARASSVDACRELAIRLEDPDVVSRLAKVVHDDWRDSRVLDLSDRAVLSDLERHPKNGELAKIAPLATTTRISLWESSGSSYRTARRRDHSTAS